MSTVNIKHLVKNIVIVGELKDQGDEVLAELTDVLQKAAKSAKDFDQNLDPTKSIEELGHQRRMDLSQNTKEELAIHDVMQMIEKLPADERLTDAVTYLAKAKNALGDFVDKA